MGFTSRIIHTKQSKADAHRATHVPIYSNAAFEFSTANDMEDAFLGRSPEHVYSRISNPTVEHFEQRIKVITGSLAVTALSTGMAAIANTFFTIARSGDTIITSKHLFGNTYSFFSSTLKEFGINTRFIDLTNPSEIESNIDGSVIAIFFETITNPQLEIVDISVLGSIAKKHNILLITDSTITPFNVFQAGQAGIHLEIVSSTKIISGGATSMGGLIIDYGNYDWKHNKKLKDFAAKFGPFAFNAKLRKEIFRNLGATLSPHHAFLQSLGLETLELRYKQASASADSIAAFLEIHPLVQSVNYPGLQGSQFFELGLKQFGKNPGSLLTFNLESKEKCFGFLNKLKLIRRATNLSDNRSLIVHPASTIFCDYPPALRLELGVPDTLIRLSVGIEETEDLIQDIDIALNN